jgi:hypothetical protein
LVKGDTSTANAPSVDFDLGTPSAKSAPSPEDDFLSGALNTVAMSSAAKSAQSPEEDFMAGALNTVATQSAEKSPSSSVDMDFDVSGNQPPEQGSGDQDKS